MKRKSSFSLLSLFFFFLLSPFVFAHGGIEHETEEEAQAHYYQGFSAVMPFVYFSQGEYFTGVLVCVLWIGVLYGFYNLSLMVLAKAMHNSTKKKKTKK